MQINGYLRKDGKAYRILSVERDRVRVEGHEPIPMHLIGQYEYLDPIREPERRTWKRQWQCSLI